MTFKLIAALLFACVPFLAHAKESAPDRETLELIYRLAERPVGVVVGDRCEIRGAIWANGPYPNARQSLVNVMTGETFHATTNAAGVYSLSIPYPGTPVVLAEQLVDQVYVLRQYADTAKVLNGGVVCDHRLRNQATSTPPQKKEKK